jgi:uncharacterized protein (DUF433 family)
LKRSAPDTDHLTIKEASVLSGVTEKVVRHELAARTLRPARTRRRHVELDKAAVAFLSLVSRLPVSLDRADRRDLFVILAGDATEVGRWSRVGRRLVLRGEVPIVVPAAETLKEAAASVRLFERGCRRVSSHPDVVGGEPVFEGTRISVRHVGERARRGEAVELLLEDFPRLTAEEVSFAALFVQLGRRPGRPRKLRLVRP